MVYGVRLGLNVPVARLVASSSALRSFRSSATCCFCASSCSDLRRISLTRLAMACLAFSMRAATVVRGGGGEHEIVGEKLNGGIEYTNDKHERK
jgi:hypothetical protein